MTINAEKAEEQALRYIANTDHISQILTLIDVASKQGEFNLRIHYSNQDLYISNGDKRFLKSKGFTIETEATGFIIKW